MHQNDKTLPNWLVIALFSVWVMATLLGLWWFQQVKLKSFIGAEDDTRYYQPRAIENLFSPYLEQLPPAKEQQQTLLHFWRADCLCNRISQRHFSQLLSEFTPEQLRIVIIAHPDTQQQEIEDLQHLNGDRLEIIRAEKNLLSLPSSPSLALFNGDNKLGYFGPYGFGAFCTSSEDSFLPKLVNRMSVESQLISFTNVIGEGCFCSW